MARRNEAANPRNEAAERLLDEIQLRGGSTWRLECQAMVREVLAEERRLIQQGLLETSEVCIHYEELREWIEQRAANGADTVNALTLLGGIRKCHGHHFQT